MTEYALSKNASEASAVAARAPYEPPILEDLGDVRDVTMGGSPGTTDSGFDGCEPGFSCGPSGG